MAAMQPRKGRFHPRAFVGRRPNEAERHINREERGGNISVSFELMSPCWAGFDIQTMRQGSTQGGRLPCNINSHLESSCGCGHETLKETAAMDPVPSHQRSPCLLQLPPHCSPKPAWKQHKPALIPPPVSRLRCRQHLGEGQCFQGRAVSAFSSSLCGNDTTEDKEMNCDGCKSTSNPSSSKMRHKRGSLTRSYKLLGCFSTKEPGIPGESRSGRTENPAGLWVCGLSYSHTHTHTLLSE